MKLTVLGSGTCVPSLTRNAPGYLLEASGRHLLLDCGSGTLLQLEKIGKSYLDIDLLLLSHTHPDHCSDLVPFIQALLVTPQSQRKETITIAGSIDISVFVKQAITLHMSWPESLNINIIEINNTLSFHGLSITSSKIEHSHNSVAYRIGHEEKSIVYSGDCDYDESLISLSKGADLLLIECSFPNSMKRKGHLTSGECGAIAQKAQVKQVVLTHFYPTPFEEDVRRKECGEVYKGGILLAEDLMSLNIGHLYHSDYV